MRVRLLAKMILFILVPAVLGLAVLGTLSTYLAREGMRTQIDSALQQAVLLQSQELDSILQLMGSATRNLSEVARIRRMLSAQEKGDDATFAKEEPGSALAMQEIKRNYLYSQDVGVLNLKGDVVVHSSPEFKGMNFSSAAYFQEAKTGKLVTDTVLSKSTGKMSTIIAHPVSVGKQVVGVVYVSLNLDLLQKNTVAKVSIGTTGYCCVFDKSGVVIMHPNDKFRNQNYGQLDWVKQVIDRDRGTVSYMWEGKKRIAYFDTVPMSDWTPIIGVDEADLLSPIRGLVQGSAIVATVIALLVGLIIFIIARQMAATLRGSAALAQYVADGNLELSAEQQATLDKDCRRGDEIGSLSRALRTMVQNLATMFTRAADKTHEAEQATQRAGEAQARAEEAARRAESARQEGMLAAAQQLEGAVEIITSASTQLAAQIEQSERGAANQAARVTETATAMEEMNSTVLEVARNASSAADVSMKTRQQAESGAQVVDKVVASIQDVRRHSLQLKTDMGQLGENAQAITQIMAVISDIADQTNLLALNAAIEAARAGEAGRGFAVVADEVRKLAEKTMASTTDVGNAIKAIQHSAHRSIDQVDVSATSIEAATDCANQSGAALKEIVSLVDSTADQVRAIATASEQQSASSEEINRSIGEVNNIATETARAMQEAAQAVSDLAAQAQVLSRLIDDMKRG